jgi:hypothetical protein
MPSWHGEGQLIVSVTDRTSETTALSEVICVLKLVNVHIELGIKKPKHVNSDLLFTIRTNTNSNNSYSFQVVTSLIDDFLIQTKINHTRIFYCCTTKLFS